MILIGLGGNLTSEDGGTPRETQERALKEIAAAGVSVLARSNWYASAPVPPSGQPDYVNAAAELETELTSGQLLELLHGIEDRLGRVRTEPNAARVIDLDLLDVHGQVRSDWPILPHPRMAARAFVLQPLLDIVPEWRHPVSGESASVLLQRAPDRAGIRLLTA